MGTRDRIVNGTSFDFYQNITVTTSAFPDECQILIAFKAQCGFAIVHFAGDPVYWSLNGNTIAGESRNTAPTNLLQFDHRRMNKLWFKLKSGTSAEIGVYAWAIV